MKTAKVLLFCLGLIILIITCSHAPENIIILCAGDSITESSYPRHLERALESAGIRTKVFNFGKSGHTSGEYLSFIKQKSSELEAVSPDFICLQLGTNDVRMDHDRTSGEEFYKNMKKILSYFKSFKNREGKKSIILIAQIPPVPKNLSFPFSIESHHRVIEEINPLIKQIAEEEKNRLVDNFSLFIRSPHLLAGVHPTEEGYRELAGNWKNALMDLIR